MSTSLSQRMIARLSQPVAAQSLAVFRIAFGALLLWDCWRFLRYDRIWRYWVEPDFHFTYPDFSWVTPLPSGWIDLAWLYMGVAALFVMLGLLYRLSIITLTVLFAYFFLLDSTEYLNHFYLVLLYALILCFLPAARVWSLDAVIQPKEHAKVPYLAVFILRAQTEIVLVYAGLVKLTPDWLRGEPLGLWLSDRTYGFWFAPLFELDWLIVLAAWGVVALHVLGAPLLLWSRTRLTIFLIYCSFHLANAWFFNIGIFPWLTIVATTIFFAPDWPMRLMARLRRRPPAPTQNHDVPSPSFTLPRIALVITALWLALQIALPVRGLAFDSETRWSGDGHRFSWRMRIYDRDATGSFILTDRNTGQVWQINPDHFLSYRQTDKMLVRPDMIHQFANHLAKLWQAEGADVEVRADICKSLNGRPCQRFIDPTVDLTRVQWNLFAADTWVLPLAIQTWGIEDNKRQAALSR